MRGTDERLGALFRMLIWRSKFAPIVSYYVHREELAQRQLLDTRLSSTALGNRAAISACGALRRIGDDIARR
jgi:hypothetical protein